MKRSIATCAVVLVTLFVAFAFVYGVANVNTDLQTTRSTANPLLSYPRESEPVLGLGPEARMYMARADRTFRASDKGSLIVSPGVLAAEEGGPIPRQTVVVIGGAGHDVVELHQDGIYARLGNGSDHVLVVAGQVGPGKRKIVRGDEGWDTVVLGTGLSIDDVISRTSPYVVRDPLTGGLYELDVEALGVIDNLLGTDVAEFPNDLGSVLVNGQPSRAIPIHPYIASSSLHYSKSISSLEASNIYTYASRRAGAQIAEMRHGNTLANADMESAAVQRLDEPRPLTLEELSLIPLAVVTEPGTKSPFGGYPAILSIEGGFFAVSTDTPLEESLIRDNVASATIAVSTTSLADSGVHLRLLTEREIALTGDLADPIAVQATFDTLVNAGVIEAVTYRNDRHIEVRYPDGAVLVFKPTLFVTRLNWALPGEHVLALDDADGRMAFAIVSPDGFAQTFVQVVDAAPPASAENPIRLGIEKNLLNDLEAQTVVARSVERLQDLVPSPHARLVTFPIRGSDEYTVRVEADGGIMYAMAETAIAPESIDATVMNLNISISSLFYSRRTAHVYMSNGDRIFLRASLANPDATLERLQQAVEQGQIETFRLTKDLLGPLNIGVTSGKYAKMMPILFGARSGIRPEKVTIVPALDGRGGRFAFAMIGPDGFAQSAVDIGGSTILPAIPKP